MPLLSFLGASDLVGVLGEGNSEKLFRRRCVNTPPSYSYNFQTNKTYLFIWFAYKKIPYSYNRSILVNTSRTKTNNLLGNYMQTYVHFACFDYECGQVSCLPKLEINGLLM